jgi:hypothetical protein
MPHRLPARCTRWAAPRRPRRMRVSGDDGPSTTRQARESPGVPWHVSPRRRVTRAPTPGAGHSGRHQERSGEERVDVKTLLARDVGPPGRLPPRHSAEPSAKPEGAGLGEPCREATGSSLRRLVKTHQDISGFAAASAGWVSGPMRVQPDDAGVGAAGSRGPDHPSPVSMAPRWR